MEYPCVGTHGILRHLVICITRL